MDVNSSRRLRSKKLGDKIYIEWIDAFTEDSWTTIDAAMELADKSRCRTNALFVGVKDDFVIVSHTQGYGKQDIMGTLNIPKSWIKLVK